MATLLDMLGDMRERLDDASDSKVSETAKKRYINFGIAATWDRLFRVVTDATNSYAPDTSEYPLLSTFGNDARIFRVELETEDGSGIWFPISDFDLLPSLSAPTLVLPTYRWATGRGIRVMAAARLSSLADDASVYDGPAGTEELPVLYAMGCSLAGEVDRRIEHRRYNLTHGANGASVEDVQGTADRWYAQFEIMLDRFAMPLPVSPI